MMILVTPFNSDEELKTYVQLSPTVSHQLPFDQGVHAQKFSGLSRTNQCHLAVFCIDRNAIDFFDFVRMVSKEKSRLLK